jgi:hypothetical protein
MSNRGLPLSIWTRVDPYITWVSLARVRNSFLSKAVTTFSMAALVLGNLGSQIEALGIDLWTTRVLLAGSGVFLIGYVLFAWLAPHEFRRGGELDELVSRMNSLADWSFFDSRRRLAARLLERSNAMRSLGPPKGAVAFLSARLKSAQALTEDANWTASSPGLFHADIDLRQHDRPRARILVACLLALGLILLLIPTVTNALKAMALL